MNLENDDVEFIDGLRAAAKNDPAVYNLLALVESTLLIDQAGNREIVGNDEELRMLQAAQLAFAFARADRGVKSDA